MDFVLFCLTAGPSAPWTGMIKFTEEDPTGMPTFCCVGAFNTPPSQKSVNICCRHHTAGSGSHLHVCGITRKPYYLISTFLQIELKYCEVMQINSFIWYAKTCAVMALI